MVNVGTPEWLAIWVLLPIGAWLAASVSGAAGFGGALLLLPLLTWVVGPRAAVPLLTIAQLCGNLSRVGFGFRDISWGPVWWFCAGAVPASVLGAWLFVGLPGEWIQRGIGVLLLAVVAARQTEFFRRPFPSQWLPWCGAIVGLLSALAGSAGPLGAAVFLSLQLPRGSYVASEAVTASVMHLTKLGVYGRFAIIGQGDAYVGALLGAAMVMGSWTGRQLIEKMSEGTFRRFVEGLMVIAAVALLIF